jgi:hypothetical protein
MRQIVESLKDQDSAEIEVKRKWVREHYEPHAQHNYETVEGKLALVDAILANCWVTDTDTLKLQCLGITFGDALAQHLGLNWVAVEDEHGRDPALSLLGTSVLAFPMTSISKRVERGEAVDVYDLFNAACTTISDMAKREAS